MWPPGFPRVALDCLQSPMLLLQPGRHSRTPPARMAQTFDFIVAYSVFTNTPRSDMLELVDELRLRLNPGGALAFTFIDPHYRSWPGEYQGDNLLWRLEREQELHPDISIDIERIRRDAQDARCSYS